MIHRYACLVLSLLALALLTAPAGAQPEQTTRRTIPAVRVTTPPVIDGNLDDACWKTLPSTSGFSDETTGALVPDDTTIRIGYDDTNVYVAFYCHDPQPQSIVARERKRGTDVRGDDSV